MVLLAFTFRWIIRNSKKQEAETKELEDRILRERREEKEKKDLLN